MKKYRVTYIQYLKTEVTALVEAKDEKEAERKARTGDTIEDDFDTCEFEEIKKEDFEIKELKG